MNIRNILTVVVLGLAALAGTSNAHSTGSVKAVQAANRPLVVYQFLSGPTWVYYTNRNRYRSQAYADHVKIFNKFTAVSFIVTASQPIRQVTFELAAYGDTYQPALHADGQPVIKQLIANGPFAPGAKQTLVNANVVWAIPPGNGLGCVRLNGMQIVYADGSSAIVSSAEIGQYFSPQLVNHCGVPPNRAIAGPSPYIAGVYPAQWMILREHERLYLQPYVSPSDTQPLCAVGSLLEETCVHAANTPDSENAY